MQLSPKGVHLSQVHQQNYWCTSCLLGALLLGWCTTTWLVHYYLVGALLLTWYTTTWLVHLRQVHPLKAPPAPLTADTAHSLQHIMSSYLPAVR